MNIYIGADHRGFELRTKLITWLQSQNYTIVDCGNTTYDKDDDWNDFANTVAGKVLNDPDSIGILICGSGVGMSMAANRHKGIRAALCFNPKQTQHAKSADHATVICLPSEYLDFETAREITEIFLKTPPSTEDRYVRREKKLDE